MSKRLTRLSQWCDENPYKVYGDYQDTISDEQAAMLLNGELTEFDESVWQWEILNQDSAWQYGKPEWDSEFATEAGYDEWDEMPEWLQEWASERFTVDCSDLIETAIGNWSGNVAATLIKRNGELIEFPHWEYDAGTNRPLVQYMRKMCGFDPGPRGKKSDATYTGTYLKALGTVDLLDIWKNGKAPTHVWLDSDTVTIGHERLNGSGTCGVDQYAGKGRWMKASFTVDSLDRYGVDSVFGLSGHMWCNTLGVR